MSDVGDILAGVGDAAEVLSPPVGLADWIAEQRSRSKEKHPSSQVPEFTEYDLTDLLEGTP